MGRVVVVVDVDGIIRRAAGLGVATVGDLRVTCERRQSSRGLTVVLVAAVNKLTRATFTFDSTASSLLRLCSACDNRAQ